MGSRRRGQGCRGTALLFNRIRNRNRAMACRQAMGPWRRRAARAAAASGSRGVIPRVSPAPNAASQPPVLAFARSWSPRLGLDHEARSTRQVHITRRKCGTCVCAPSPVGARHTRTPRRPPARRPIIV
eukprot:6440473-Prymnesium_polylepis.1